MLVLAYTATAWAGVPLRDDQTPLHWKDSHLILRFSRAIKSASGETRFAGVEARESVESVHGALRAAVDTWNQLNLVRIDIEVTDQQLAIDSTVTFTDPTPFDNGMCNKTTAVACTLLTYTIGAGELLTASIAFNPYLRHSTAGIIGTYDIGQLMLHEIGHALGLDHSVLRSSAMNPMVELSDSAALVFPYRQLGPDDALSLAAVYPPGGRLSAAISGTVLPAGTHVYAIRQDGVAVRDTNTDFRGRYTLNLSPGAYTVLAEVPGRPIATTSDPVILNEATTLDGVDLGIPSNSPINLDWLAVVDSLGNFSGAPRIALARGSTYRILINRSPVEGSPDIQISAPSLQLAGGPQMITSLSNFPGLVLQKITLPVDTPLGSYNVQYSNEFGRSILAGAFRVSVNPSGCALQPAEDPQITVLTGTDLAETAQTAPPGMIATQLGGVSIMFKNQFIPMLSASPTEIRFGTPADFAPPADVCTMVAVR